MDCEKHLNVETRLTEVEQRAKSNTHRIDALAEKQGELAKLITSVEVLASREANVETDVKEIKADVKTLTGRSGRRWDDLADKLLWLVLGAAAAALAAELGITL